jgi:hypothetical protein
MRIFYIKNQFMRLYYMLWVDCITGIREKDEEGWEIKSMVAMSLSMITNFAFFDAILERNILGRNIYKIDLPFLFKYMANFASFIILFILPVLLVNYLLIFYNKRYEILLKKYPYKKGKLFLTCFLASMLIPIILLWIGIVFF